MTARITSNIALTAAGQGIEKGIAFVVIAVLIRYLDKSLMGEYFFAISVLSLVVLLTEGGTSRHLVRSVAADTTKAALNPRRLCDGIPQKLLNYMASGCAIISFKGSARFLRHRESGWIAEGNDAAAFAEGIAHVLNDPALARKIGEKAYTIVAEALSWGNAAERAEGIYLQLTHTDPSP